MLRDITPLQVPIKLCGKELYLRYNLNSHLYLEHYYQDGFNEFLDKRVDEYTQIDIIHILRAGLMDCYFAENEKVINKQQFGEVTPSIAGVGRMVDTCGEQKVMTIVLEALLASLPPITEEVQGDFQQGASSITGSSDISIATS